MSEPTQIPVHNESIGGALIDSARISVMGALHILPSSPVLIIAPGGPEEPSVHECLAQAMEWLNAARSLNVEQSAALPTSLHVIKGGP